MDNLQPLAQPGRAFDAPASMDLGEFRAQALARPDVRREYDRLDDEFAALDQSLEGRVRQIESGPVS
jgi:hypothetical protein